MSDDSQEFLQKMSVLAIDDEDTTAKLYVSLFKEMGHNVVVAKTGSEVVDKVREQRFDLIILDLKLPDIHGNELLNQIQDKIEGAPVIIVTANPSLESSVEAIRTGGVYDYIAKPFDMKKLKMVVKRAVEKVSLTTENKRLLRKLEVTNKALSQRVDELESFAQEAVGYEGKLTGLAKQVKELQLKLKKKSGGKAK